MAHRQAVLPRAPFAPRKRLCSSIAHHQGREGRGRQGVVTAVNERVNSEDLCTCGPVSRSSLPLVATR